MGTFTDPLDLRWSDENPGRDFILTHSFTYRTSLGGQRYFAIVVPAGFVTDFASIPRAFWRVLPPTGRYGKAAVVHDYLYRTPEIQVTRAEADKVFLDAMADLGVGTVTRRTMWAAVRTFGGRAFQPRTSAPGRA